MQSGSRPLDTTDVSRAATSGHRDESRRHGGARSVGPREWRMPPSGCRTAIAAAGEPFVENCKGETEPE